MTEEAITESTEQPRKNPYDGMRKGLMALGLLFILWLAGGRVIPQLLFGDEHPPAKTTTAAVPVAPVDADYKTRVEALESRLDQLEAKLKTYEEVAAAAPANTQDNAVADANIAEWQAGIEARIEKLAGTPHDVQVNQQQLQSLEKRIDESEGKASGKLAVFTAFGQLKDALLRGDPYASQLKNLRALSQENKPAQDLLTQLAAFSESGIPRHSALQASFAEVIPKALSASSGKSLLGNVRSLVQIRKVGEQQTGNDDSSIIARAEAKLSRGDIEGCLKELTLLSPPAASVFTDWSINTQAVLRNYGFLDALQLALTETPASPATEVPAAKPAAPKPEPIPAPAPAEVESE